MKPSFEFVMFLALTIILLAIPALLIYSDRPLDIRFGECVTIKDDFYGELRCIATRRLNKNSYEFYCENDGWTFDRMVYQDLKESSSDFKRGCE